MQASDLGYLSPHFLSYFRPPLPSENERPNMGKILSFSYDREWKQENQKWHNKQDKIKEKFDNMTRRKVVPVVTEYKQNFNTLEKKNTQKILGYVQVKHFSHFLIKNQSVAVVLKKKSNKVSNYSRLMPL